MAYFLEAMPEDETAYPGPDYGDSGQTIRSSAGAGASGLADHGHDVNRRSDEVVILVFLKYCYFCGFVMRSF